ncbi:MAG: GNAT family N-acetyltransferase [Gemmobacter sp.]|uniref:GNAT family N-acetyltransferase n=1 Tax=Gemmobacter sp. TaxID=1898957 RepID=UPI001A4F4CF1|nr:GNAT family N-acetyltransferase [Gemmobacter sp.]MBL8562428.1 GNAT family N-acetyltransferase [Gemmobacter sp.]
MSWTIAPTADIAACLALRRAVFIEEQGIAEAEEIDDLDGEALHLLALQDGQPLGTARLLRKGATGKIGRVCVLAEARGTGLGAALIRAGIAHFAADPAFDTVYLSAQEPALGFYEKLGFTAHGPAYDDAGIPHRDMTLPLR